MRLNSNIRSKTKLIIIVLSIGLSGAAVSCYTNSFGPAIGGSIGAIIGIGISIYMTIKTPTNMRKSKFSFYNRYGRQDERMYLVMMLMLFGSISTFLWQLLILLLNKLTFKQ
jgi:hypothetical protein